MLARDVMDTRFHLLRPQDTLTVAVKMFRSASQKEGKKIFGLMVVDENDLLEVDDKCILLFAPDWSGRGNRTTDRSAIQGAPGGG